jgi:hypothetical protein
MDTLRTLATLAGAASGTLVIITVGRSMWPGFGTPLDIFLVAEFLVTADGSATSSLTPAHAAVWLLSGIVVAGNVIGIDAIGGGHGSRAEGDRHTTEDAWVVVVVVSTGAVAAPTKSPGSQEGYPESLRADRAPAYSCRQRNAWLSPSDAALQRLRQTARPVEDPEGGFTQPATGPRNGQPRRGSSSPHRLHHSASGSRGQLVPGPRRHHGAHRKLSRHATHRRGP